MALLEVRGVSKSYRGLRALNGVDLFVHESKFHGLIGPNGSGKSTLLKCIAGAKSPSGGTICFAGRNITEAPAAERARAGLSIKFQITSVLPSLSVYDNILLALQAQDSVSSLIFSRTRGSLDEKALMTLDQFLLTDHRNEVAGTLSHGQQQWLEMAMALAPGPKLLLLDEPTAGMSIEERRITGELLQPIKRRCSIVIVEHDIDFIRDVCDELTVLDQGSVLNSGSAEHIRKSKKVQEVYLTRVSLSTPRSSRCVCGLWSQPSAVRYLPRRQSAWRYSCSGTQRCWQNDPDEDDHGRAGAGQWGCSGWRARLDAHVD